MQASATRLLPLDSAIDPINDLEHDDIGSLQEMADRLCAHYRMLSPDRRLGSGFENEFIRWINSNQDSIDFRSQREAQSAFITFVDLLGKIEGIDAGCVENDKPLWINAGSGWGADTNLLPYAVRLIELDKEYPMLQKARDNRQIKSIRPEVLYLHTDMEHLPLANNVARVVYTRGALRYLLSEADQTRLRKGCIGIERVLEPRGFGVLSEIGHDGALAIIGYGERGGDVRAYSVFDYLSEKGYSVVKFDRNGERIEIPDSEVPDNLPDRLNLVSEHSERDVFILPGEFAIFRQNLRLLKMTTLDFLYAVIFRPESIKIPAELNEESKTFARVARLHMQEKGVSTTSGRLEYLSALAGYQDKNVYTVVFRKKDYQ